MNPDWKPIEASDVDLLSAALSELGNQLAAAAHFPSWPKPGSPESSLDLENESNKQDQIQIEQERISRLLEVLAAYPLARATEPVPTDTRASQASTFTLENLDVALGRQATVLPSADMPDDVDRDASRRSAKLETLREAKLCLDLGASNVPYPSEAQLEEYHIELAGLMTSVAGRLTDEGLEWNDIALVGDQIAQTGGFKNAFEELSNIFVQTLDPEFMRIPVIRRRSSSNS